LLSIKSCNFFQLDPPGNVPAVSLGTRPGQVIRASQAANVKSRGATQRKQIILQKIPVYFKRF
jgi:hypothetical protein